MSSPEQNLWRVVLLRAIRDAVFDDRNSISDVDCAEARKFLLRDDVDFPIVAMLAGYEPTWLRNQIRQVI